LERERTPMPREILKYLCLSDGDLDFLVDTASPKVTNKPKLKQIIREDEDFKNSFIAADKLFRRLMDDEGIFLKISPALFFQILPISAFSANSLGCAH
jgi:hypothetical protein